MILSNTHFYIVGIKGSAMVNIAAILKNLGKEVSGADVEEVFPTDTVLLQNSIKWVSFDKAELPEDTEVVVYGAAHGGKTNTLIQEAEKKGIQVVHQAELLGELLKEYTTAIAVAGCHGKTTTSSLLSYALIQLGQNPSYMVGTPSFNEYQGSSVGDKELFVVEADEYALHPPEDKTPKFHYLKPTNAILTNIDFDHPDVFDSLEDTKKAFQTFMENVSSTNDALSLIVCADDENLMDVVKKIKGKSVASYGISEEAQYRAKNIRFHNEVTTFSVFFQDEKIGDFIIKIPGEKNVVNATGVITLLFQLGFAPDEIRNAIEGFEGAKRRFEHIGSVNGIEVFDDYAHHPSELHALIQAARSRYPERKIRLLFQPHTFSRTESLAQDFIEAFQQADTTIVLAVFASAREQKTENAFDNKKLQEMSKDKNILAPQSNKEAIQMVKDHIQGNDIVLMAGAGDIYKLQKDLLAVL